MAPWPKISSCSRLISNVARSLSWTSGMTSTLWEPMSGRLWPISGLCKNRMCPAFCKRPTPIRSCSTSICRWQTLRSVKKKSRRFPRSEIDQHFWVFQRSSRVLEDHRETPQPRNRLARLVESGFAQDRVVAALVEVDDDPFRLDFDHTTCFHAFAIQLFGRSGVKASQLLGQPAIAPIGQYSHSGVEVDVESHFARQTIEVKEIHADPQPVLDAIASGVADDQCPRTLLEVVGQEQGRALPSP